MGRNNYIFQHVNIWQCVAAITRILVPLDGSENAQRGLTMAITIAKACQADITGIYSDDAQSRSEFGTEHAEDHYSEEVDKIMADAAELATKNGIVFSEKKMKGNTGYNIVKMAHGQDHFDMIVIGSRGRSSAKEMFFGSVSNYVIHASKIPVMVVK